MAAELEAEGFDLSMFGGQGATQEEEVPYFSWSAMRGGQPGPDGTMEFALEVNADEAAQAFARMPKAQRARIQKMLWEGGFFDAPYYNPKERIPVAWGEIDQASLQAFGAALGLASFTGDLDDVLSGVKGPNRRSRLLYDHKKEQLKKTGGLDPINPNAIEDYMMSVDKLANEFMLPMSEEAKRKWAQDVMRGKQNPRRDEFSMEEEYGV